MAALALLVLTAVGATPSSVPGYRLTTPSGWRASRSGDGVRFSRRASDGASVEVQLRMPVAEEISLPRVVASVLASIEATDGISEPFGGAITTERVGRVVHAFVTRSYRDRDGTPVFLYVCAIRTGTATGVVQAESRSSAAFNELGPDVAALISSMRIDGRTANRRIGASLLTPPASRRETGARGAPPADARGHDGRALRRRRMT